MGEKRFNFIKDSVAENLKTPIADNDKVLCIGEVLNELNKLNEENKQLKSSNMEYEDALARLEEKNEQLKRTISALEYELKKCQYGDFSYD